MRGNPGKIVRWLDDKRTFIVYNNQPLLKAKSMVILTIVDDENYQPILGPDNKPKVLVQKLSLYNERLNLAKVIGLVD